MSTFDAGPLEGLPDASLRGITADGRRIVLVRIGEEVFALQDQCTHEEFPLSEGWIEDGALCCAFHGARFDPRTGAALALPAYEALKTFPTAIVDGRIIITLD